MVDKRVVLITGASSGIGRATALAFARAGFHAAGTARRSDRLAELEAEIQALTVPHGDFLAITADVTDAEAMRGAVAQIMERFGRLDILVANAGLGQRGAVADADWCDLETVLRTNIDGVLHSIRAAVPAMRQSGGGQIITISSVLYNVIAPYAATYSATKAFVTSMANSLRMELDADHIHVTDVLLGRTRSEFNEKRLGTGQRRESRVPTMPAEQVADAIVKAAERHPKTVVVRWFDRLTLLVSLLAPGIMGRVARKQYQ